MGGFYEDQPEQAFRLGDVITGFQLTRAQIHHPSKERGSWSIAIERPRYLAVMTPCCSIEKKSIVLAPLVSVRPSFYRNPYFAEDLTRINREVAPEKSVAPAAWEKNMSREHKEKLLAIGPAYMFQDCFIYDKHDLLIQYQLDSKHPENQLSSQPPKIIGCYMVDFKSTYRIDCDMIDRDKPSPPNTKILQLSVPAREGLRRKLAHYFARIPEEDAQML